jgi:hypothetical protein
MVPRDMSGKQIEVSECPRQTEHQKAIMSTSSIADKKTKVQAD